VSVRLLRSSTDERCLVAFAVGRRTGTAVVRNRIRRRLRAALAEIGAAGDLPAGTLVVSAGASVATAPFGEVRQDLRRALGRAARRPEATP
jgi:ribonuclease P protein component